MKATLKVIISVFVLGSLGYLVFRLFFAEQGTPVTQSGPLGSEARVTSSAAATSSIPVSVVTIQEQASTSPSISAEYPQFPSLPADFNNIVAAAMLTRISDFRKESADNMAARRATGDPRAEISSSDFSFIGRWQSAQINDRYVSFIMRFDSYTGGANENSELQTFNYDVKAHTLMNLSDLFGTSTAYLSRLSEISRQQLAQSMGDASNGNAPADMITAGTEPVYDNFKNFTFTGYALTVYFPKYAVGPGSFGEQHATISWKEL